MVRGLTVKDAPGRRSTRIEKVFKKKKAELNCIGHKYE